MDKNTRGIVVGYDGSADADAALRWAADTAALEDLPLRAVMVDQVDASPWGGVYWEPDVGVVAQADLIIEKAGVRGSSELVTGHVVPVLIEAASDASLLVVGSQGHGRGGEILLGSVSQHLARQAKCPVVVVRQPAHPSADRIVVGVDGSGESAGALEFACRRAELTGEVVVAVHGWKAGNLLVGRDGQLPHDIGQKIEEKEAAARRERCRGPSRPPGRHLGPGGDPGARGTGPGGCLVERVPGRHRLAWTRRVRGDAARVGEPRPGAPGQMPRGDRSVTTRPDGRHSASADLRSRRQDGAC